MDQVEDDMSKCPHDLDMDDWPEEVMDQKYSGKSWEESCRLVWMYLVGCYGS